LGVAEVDYPASAVLEILHFKCQFRTVTFSRQTFSDGSLLAKGKQKEVLKLTEELRQN